MNRSQESEIRNQKSEIKNSCGAVMMEMLLVLPVILFIISLLFFFGTGMANAQRSSVMDRYAVWRSVANAPGPSSESQLNSGFFDGQADGIDMRQTKFFPADTANYLIDAVDMISGQAGDYAEALIRNLPSGQRFSFTTTHNSSIPMWQRLGGSNNHAHVRFDNEWKYANGIAFSSDAGWVPAAPYVVPSPTIRDEFFSEFDDVLQPYVDNGNRLARLMQNFYLQYPAYQGPDVPTEWAD